MLFHALFLTGGVIGGGELLSDLFSQQVFKELGFLNTRLASEASGFDFDLSVV